MSVGGRRYVPRPCRGCSSMATFGCGWTVDEKKDSGDLMRKRRKKKCERGGRRKEVEEGKKQSGWKGRESEGREKEREGEV